MDRGDYNVKYTRVWDSGSWPVEVEERKRAVKWCWWRLLLPALNWRISCLTKLLSFVGLFSTHTFHQTPPILVLVLLFHSINLPKFNEIINMVGPKRPLFVLFGSSIVQLSYSNGGWGAILSDIYSRKVRAYVISQFFLFYFLSFSSIGVLVFQMGCHRYVFQIQEI